MDKKLTSEQIQEFHSVLRGRKPAEGVKFGKGNKPKMTAEKSFAIIWYLQEVLRIIPDTFEMCTSCKDIYDTCNSGLHCDKCDKFLCNACMDDCKHTLDEQGY